jgi:hypothetical protein
MLLFLLGMAVGVVAGMLVGGFLCAARLDDEEV